MDPIVLVLKVAFGLYILAMVGVSAFVWIAYRRDPYPPEAAEAPDPVEQAFADARRIVTGRLPSSSVDELLEQFDWHAHEYEMRKQT